MNDHFVVRYIPGGMTLNHSGWWLCEEHWNKGCLLSYPIKMLRRSDYNKAKEAQKSLDN